MKGRRRKAILLVEMALVMTLSVVLLGVLVALLVKVLAIKSASQDHLENLIAIGQFSEQFRCDVREARQATVEGRDGVGGTLSLEVSPTGHVVYESTAEGVERTVLKGERNVSRETYRLHGLVALQWNVSESEKPEVSLLLARSGELPDAPPNLIPSFAITSVLGAERNRGAQP